MYYKHSISLAVLIAASSVGRAGFAQKVPITGTAVAEFASLDLGVIEFMKLIGCQAVTLAISKDDELVYSRGYGWRDYFRKQPTQPDSMMRIGFATKGITAAAVRNLIRDDKLELETRAFDYLKIAPPPGVKPDPRLAKITVAHLLEDKAGWDRAETFDPMGRCRQVEEYFHLRRPAKPIDIIRYMLGQPLQFDPGERWAYSNFTYCVLGRVIEKASRKPYGTYIRNSVCKPLEIKDIKLARNLAKDRDPREVSYPEPDFAPEYLDSDGGLVGTAPALCTFLEHYWLSGTPRQIGSSGESTLDGSIPCLTSIIRQRRDGYNFAVLCNNRRYADFAPNAQFIIKDDQRLQKLVDEAIDKMVKAKGE